MGSKLKTTMIVTGVLGVVAGVSWGVWALIARMNRPKVPEDTVLAVYVDLGRAASSFESISREVVNRLPEKQREAARDKVDELITTYRDDFRCFKPEWACFTLGASYEEKDGRKVQKFHPALVVKCKCDAHNKQGNSLRDIIEEKWTVKPDKSGEYKRLCFSKSVEETNVVGVTTLQLKWNIETREERPVRVRNTRKRYSWEDDYTTEWRLSDWEVSSEHIAHYVAFVKGKYVIAAADADRLAKMISLYRDGKGETSKAFDDLADIDRKTVARVQTCTVKELARIYDFEPLIKGIADDCEDKELSKAINKMGDVKLDLKATGKILGGELSVDAGTEDLAKALEGLCCLGRLYQRGACDAIIGGKEYAKSICETLKPVLSTSDREKIMRALSSFDVSKAQVKKFRESTKINRSGTRVSAEWMMETSDALDLIMAPIMRESAKSSSLFSRPSFESSSKESSRRSSRWDDDNDSYDEEIRRMKRELEQLERDSY